jgi:hypothetical protein
VDFQHMRCFLAEHGRVGGAIKTVGEHRMICMDAPTST